ncbi:MAG: hypothetical protein LBT40_06145 [Deltaproteobacteria bacterium]|jgi:hypothetical protein|nr:hypothetical protein [Deltaproteobacteria bacterium]
MAPRTALVAGTIAFALTAYALTPVGASAQESPAAGANAAKYNDLAAAPAAGETSALSRYYVGAWLDWHEGLGAAYRGLPGRDRLTAVREAPFGTGGLTGFSFGGGYSFPFLNRGTLGLYGALNLTGVGSEVPGEPPSLYGYSRSTPFRTRLGGRFSHAFSTGLRGYLGLAWDHGFGGVRYGSRTARIPLSGPDGSAAFAEMGLRIADFGNFDFDLATYGLSSGDGGDSVGGMTMKFTF